MQTTLNLHAEDSEAVQVTTITNKALTSNVATLTTGVSPHGLKVGDRVIIADVDATFDGTYVIASVPTNGTFTYAKTHANVVSAAVSPAGTVSRVPTYVPLEVGGRRGQTIILRNLGPGDISYDFTEPDEGVSVVDTGFVLAADAQEKLTFEGTLYLSSDADDTDLRYAVV